MDELDKLCREVWGAYQYLRDHDLAAQSGTSKRLRRGDTVPLRLRLIEELYELRGVVEGTHFHEGFAQDLVLEGYEVLYWAFLTALTQNISYAELDVASQLQTGFEAERLSRSELLPHFTFLISQIEHAGAGLAALPVSTLAQVVYLVGRACALNVIPPARLLERDRSEMRQKEYLAAYWNSRAAFK